MNYWESAPGIYSDVDSSMVLAEFPAGHEIDYMCFSTQHWARLLNGYSGFIVLSPEFIEANAEVPSATAVARLERLGATHLTYNCAFERSETRCQAYLQELNSNALIERVFSVDWQGSTAHLFRFR